MAVSFGPKITAAFVSAAQGDNYYTAGEALLRMVQTLVQPNAISIGLNTPPALPTNGNTYVVGSAPTGVWATHANSVAYWSTDNPATPLGEWEFYAPIAGWVIGNQADNTAYIFNGTAWIQATNVYVPTGFVPGTFTANQALIYIPVDRTVTFPANFVSSQAVLQVATTGSTVFSILNGVTQIGTITFAPSGTVGVYASTGGIAHSFTAGQILSIVAPASPDATAAGLGFSLSGTR